MTDSPAQLRDLVFRGLLFESEAEEFRSAGISVGVDLSSSEEALLQEALSPFGVQRRNTALEMGRLYTVLHCFENELRSFIRDTLEEQVGVDWWKQVPKNIREKAENRQTAAMKDSWLEGDKADNLGFADFGDLAGIIFQFWQHFSDILPSQSWIEQRMVELEKARNFVAHNRMLLPSEFQRLYMYVSDWNKVIGL